MTSSSSATAIITGASSGLGAACARTFAEAGWGVALVARRADALEEVRQAAQNAGRGRAVAFPGDVTDPVAMRTCAARALAAFGRLDVLVCCAGIGFQGALDETTPEVLQRLLEVNVVGTLNAARAVVPYFLAQTSGHLIVVSSIVGKRGIPGYGAYAASKFAQTGLAESLRAEFRGSGVAVTTVFPVSVRTAFRDAIAREFGIRVHGGGPAQSADEVARAILAVTRTRAPELYPYRRARLLALINALMPRLADRLAARFARRRRPIDEVDHDR
ncbi:MAG: SDR family NAD(P)-dependent oxidoreductase [Vicinamibacterales bacterium]